MYEFSIPMPLHSIGIDYIIALNKNIEKSKISSIYFALPGNDDDVTGFEQNRVHPHAKSNFSTWKPILEKAKEKDIEIIYLLNSPKPLDVNNDIFPIQLEKLDRLISNLKSSGCYSLRVSNIQLLDYLLKNYPEMNYYLSTSFEWTQYKQYKNFLETFPQIKQIVPSFNINKDFKQLKNIKTNFPNIEIELMVNEGCIAGCPFRTEHNNSLPSFYKKQKNHENKSFTLECYLNKCYSIYDKNVYQYICTSNIIHPWEIEYYGKMGINKFKLVGRNSHTFSKGQYLKAYTNYLKGVDNYKNIEELDYRILNHYIIELDFSAKIKDVRPYLPDIQYFIKNGHMCSSICGSECNYCYKCAENLQKALESK